MTTEMDEIVLLTIGLRRPSNFRETYYYYYRHQRTTTDMYLLEQALSSAIWIFR